MNQRKQKDIARIDELFREIGAGEPPPPLPVREIKRLYGTPPERTEFEFSESCQKVIYPSYSAAHRVVRKRQYHGAAQLRIYKCEKCGGFHLTSSFSKI